MVPMSLHWIGRGTEKVGTGGGCTARHNSSKNVRAREQPSSMGCSSELRHSLGILLGFREFWLGTVSGFCFPNLCSSLFVCHGRRYALQERQAFKNFHCFRTVGPPWAGLPNSSHPVFVHCGHMVPPLCLVSVHLEERNRES